MSKQTPAELAERFATVRRYSMALAEPLTPEDQCVQSMPEASPTKWHLAHTSWFFESVILTPHVQGYREVNAQYARLFNSYYECLGPRHPRPQRGLLTRPSLQNVHTYRSVIDAAMHELILTCPAERWSDIAPLIELGVQHEQQHQELMLTDILHAMWLNPMLPTIRAGLPAPVDAATPGWCDHAGGDVPIGHDPSGFAFDNEQPRHVVKLAPFSLANRLVTNQAFQQFIDDGGYKRAALWLSDGWAAVQTHGWQAPLYWLEDAQAFTLHGVQPRQADGPVQHLSFFEAAAFAEWAGARLPTEFEWEAAVVAAEPPAQVFGHAWQWTRSSYDPYPRFRPLPGAIGEYNGKFMVGQIVLRGSSSATPVDHARATYRNFFPPATRWQYAGLRLARDL